MSGQSVPSVGRLMWAKRVSNSLKVCCVHRQEFQLVMKRMFYSAKPTPGSSRRSEGGFTMVEAMVVIAISAILMGLAAPSMRNLIERNGLNESVDSLTSSIALARAEAIKRGLPVALCRSTGAENGTPSCNANTAWNTGWLVFVDFEGDGSFDAGSGDVLLRVQGSLEKNGKLDQKSYRSIVFRPTGMLNSASTSFAFESPGRSIARTLCIGVGGRARLTEGTCS